MAKISGSGGTCTAAAGTTVAITNWTLDVAGEVIGTTDSGDSTWDTFIASGWTNWSGTFEGFAISGVADLTLGAAAAALVLVAGAPNQYSGSAILTGVSTSVDVAGAEAVKKSYTFQGTGALTQGIS